MRQGGTTGTVTLSLLNNGDSNSQGSTGDPDGSPATDPARAFLIERLSRFYDFQGLFRWKRKFAPVFEARFLVFADPLALPRIALALIRAQTPGGLLSFVRRTHELPEGKPAPRTEAA